MEPESKQLPERDGSLLVRSNSSRGEYTIRKPLASAHLGSPAPSCSWSESASSQHWPAFASVHAGAIVVDATDSSDCDRVGGSSSIVGGASSAAMKKWYVFDLEFERTQTGELHPWSGKIHTLHFFFFTPPTSAPTAWPSSLCAAWSLRRAGFWLTVCVAKKTNTQLQQLCAWVPLLATAPACPSTFTSWVKAALGMRWKNATVLALEIRLQQQGSLASASPV